MDKTINFKVEENFYKDIKIHIAKKGITLKDYVIQLIKNDLEKFQTSGTNE